MGNSSNSSNSSNSGNSGNSGYTALVVPAAAAGARQGTGPGTDASLHAPQGMLSGAGKICPA